MSFTDSNYVIVQIQIFGEGELEPNRDAALLVSIECCKYDFPQLVAAKLALLDFESRKDAAQVSISISQQFCVLKPLGEFIAWGKGRGGGWGGGGALLCELD